MRSLLLLLGAWVVVGLIGHDPWKPDEAYTFGLVYHILETGQWLVPTLAGEPFVEKPPLFFWSAAIFAKALGWALPLHDAARLAAGFYVALTLWFTYLASGRRIAAPLLLAGCLGYLQHAHQLITDNALLAGIAIGLYGLGVRKGLWLGTGAGVAFLSKGLIGPGLLGLTAVLALVLPAWRQSWRAWPAAAAGFLPWAVIWPWLLYRASPALFEEWFWVNNFGRFTGSAGLGGVLDHWHYLKALVWFGAPAWPLAAWALWASRRALAPATQLWLLALAVMLVVLSTASSARTLYGLPLLIPLSLVAAEAAHAPPRWVDRALAALFALLGAALWAAWLAHLAGWRPAFLESPGFVPRFAVIGFAAAVGLSALWVFSLKLQPALPARWLAGVSLVWGLAMTLWLPWLDHAKSYRGMIADMQRARAGIPGCVATLNLGEPQRALFHYFAGIRAPADPGCALVLVQTSGKPPTPPGALRLLWRGTRPGEADEVYWLFSR